MRRALHLGVQKALGVVRFHYEINFEAVAEGYIVPEGVEDEVAMERVDALAVTLLRRLPKPSKISCSQTPSMLMLLRPEDCWAPGPFLFVC
jgi:hypothetical protein